MADFNLYGCGWLEFNKFSERPGNGRPAVSSCDCEIDLNAADILNRYSLHQVKAEGEPDSFPATGDEISSLKQIEVKDRARRRALKLPSYIKSPPVARRCSEPRWERNEEYSKLLDSLLESASMAPSPAPDTQIDHLPTAFEIVDVMFNRDKLFRGHEVKEPASSTESDSSAPQNQPATDPSTCERLPEKLFKKQWITAKARSEASLSSILFSSSENLEQVLHGASESLDHNFQKVEGSRISSVASWRLATEPAAAQLIFKYLSPSTDDVASTFGCVYHPEPFYSNAKDMPLFPFVYGGKEFHIPGEAASTLAPFSLSENLSFTTLQTLTRFEGDLFQLPRADVSTRLEFVKRSPTSNDVKSWFSEHTELSESPTEIFALPSLGAVSGNEEDMSILALEVITLCREGKVPHPEHNAVEAVVWKLESTRFTGRAFKSGIITTKIVRERSEFVLKYVQTEQSLFENVINMVLYFDPDIICGYETNSRSWGYLNSRYKHLYDDEFYNHIGRINDGKPAAKPPNVEIAITGRILMSVWTILRKQANLLRYSLEHVVYHALHQTIPHYEFDKLSLWWQGMFNEVEAVVDYYVQRVEYTLALLEHFEIVSRYSEQARIVGIDFLSVITRGSQYNVEAVLCRLAKRRNFILVSPTRQQVKNQNALEYIPLVMEPLSAYYTDPVCVLDFQSLYPSLIIAYNLCYSTSLGRLDSPDGKRRLGIIDDFQTPSKTMANLSKHIYIAPNGMMYVKASIRRSLLAQMLQEVLHTRFMLQDSMKFNKTDPRYQRNLNNQQLALKYIANVTYGYTSASFSGRMPCAELADSIVLSGRETLVKTLKTIESSKKWGIDLKVVYGDTDSLFVKIPGVSKQQAFRIGAELADMITADNPYPVKLKLEKVYCPSILLTKKRYVGLSWDSAESTKPRFDAKGTETVRRDGTPIEAKIEKKALEMFFNEPDFSQVKKYFQNSWLGIMKGQFPVEDFCFAREVRLGTYRAAETSLPGGVVVSLKKLLKDEAAGPQYRERVPFVVAAGSPGSRIAERCVSPEEMVKNPSLMIDAQYYIQQNIIPSLDRIFSVIGANIKSWYGDMAKSTRFYQATEGTTLRSYMHQHTCYCCLSRNTEILCDSCIAQREKSVLVIKSQRRIAEKSLMELTRLCRLCSGVFGQECSSIDCPVYSTREDAINRVRLIKKLEPKALSLLKIDE